MSSIRTKTARSSRAKAALPSVAAMALLFACAESATGSAPDDGGSSPPPDVDSGASDDGSAPLADADLDVDAPAPKGCNHQGFCLDELPNTEIPIGIWGSKDDDVWAVTDRSIFHFDGTSWTTALTLPADGSRIRSIYGAAADDVWVVGEGASVIDAEAGSAREALVLHYASRDGGPPAWRSLHGFDAAPSLVEAWRTSDGAVWFIADALVFRSNGEEAGAVADVTLVPFPLPQTMQCSATGQCRLNRVTWLTLAGFGDEVWVAGYAWDPPPLGFHRPLLARYHDSQWSSTILAQGTGHGLPVRIPKGLKPGEDARFRVSRDGSRRAFLYIASEWVEPEDAFVLDVGEDGSLTPVAGQTPATWLACRPKAVFAPSADAAWLTDGYGVCRWDGTRTTFTSITIDAPLLRPRGLWSGDSTTWIVGERQLAMGAPPDQGVGFVLRRAGGLP